MRKLRKLFGFVLLMSALEGACGTDGTILNNAAEAVIETLLTSTPTETVPQSKEELVHTDNVFREVNGNIPYFTEEEKAMTKAFESYSELDDLGRCGTAFALLDTTLMPTEKRGEIGHIKPSGWHTYNLHAMGFEIDGNYLYNRCHLIAFMLAGENDNEKNLITGTRSFNVTGMLPFEEEVADYIRKTKNPVLYRVTPVYEGDNLVAEGVLMEAYSTEDNGKGVCFCVFVNNIQPGITIDYRTGEMEID